MKRSLLDRAAWAVAGALAVALIGSLAGVVRGGPLDPPGAPASTMKTLGDVEPRIPIRQPASAAGFPIMINTPGSYYLAEDITGVTGTNGIWLAADAVTIDLNGFALLGVAGSSSGIWFAGPHRNASVHGGTISGWGQNGIDGDWVRDSTFEDLRLYGNGGGGIRASGNSLISHVVATNNGAHGILMNNNAGEGGIIRDSTASDNAMDGIQVLGSTLVVDNTSFDNSGSQSTSSTPATGSTPTTCDEFAVGALAIKVDNANNVIIRNSIRGRELGREYRGGERGGAAGERGHADQQPVGEHCVLEVANAMERVGEPVPILDVQLLDI